MSLADQIRDFVDQHYLKPARAEGRRDLRIRAGDVHKAMKLVNRVPVVCSALAAGIFRDHYHVELIARQGPTQGANGVFVFALGTEDQEAPGSKTQQPSSNRRPVTKGPSRPSPAAKPRRPKKGDATGTVYLVSCVSKKLSTAAAAKDLYVSTWFRLARHYVDITGCPWFILSAEHGLLAPDDFIEPYNTTLNHMAVAGRRNWALRVRQQMENCLPVADSVAILAGQRYREFLMDYLASRFSTVEVPMKHLAIGEQLHWLGQQA